LKNDYLYLGLVATAFEEQGIIEKLMFYEDFDAYFSNNHPLLEKKKLDTGEMQDSEHWVLQQGHCFREQVLGICRQKKFQRKNFHYESGSLEGLKNMVDRYKGVTLLPQLATLDLNESEKARLRPFAGEQTSREISLVLTRSFLKIKLVELLFKEIVGALPKEISLHKKGTVQRFR